MKKEIIKQLYSAFEQAALEVDGVECWSARELCTLLGYSQWRNFVGVIDKAKIACENVGHNVSDHLLTSAKWFLWDLVQKEKLMIIHSPVMPAIWWLRMVTHAKIR